MRYREIENSLNFAMRTPACILIGLIAGCGLSALRAEASSCDLTQVPYCTWTWSNNGFFDVGDTGAIINFETLPNGIPSTGGVNITPAFNYVIQGALFTSPFPGLKIVGNSQLGYALAGYTSNPLAQNSITAQLTNPQRGVGVRVIDHSTLLAYDAQGSLIASVSYHDLNNVEYFLGIKSNIPIARVVVDRHSNSASLDDFTMIHLPVPEPATAALLLFAAPLLIRRPRRRNIRA